jgi:light-regulated signal transduction histidine kinase (bacteriophytochrome)
MEPFQQIDNELSRRFEGTGLGLPLTKALVELHNGVLLLVSKPGVGTTATVRLPMVTQLAGSSVPRGAATPPGRGAAECLTTPPRVHARR